MIVKIFRRATGRMLRALGLYPFYEKNVIPFWRRRIYLPLEKAVYWLKYRNKPVLLSFQGHEVRINLDSQNTRVFSGLFIQNEGPMLAFLLSHVQPGDCIWDVGANRGMFSMFFSKQVGPKGRVYSFEPEARIFRSLLANIRLNEADNVTPMRCALSRENGEASLLTAGTGRHTLIPGSDQYDGTQTVPIVRGDSLPDRDIKLPNAIKIDVEGAEFDVLAGLSGLLTNPHLRCIGMEIHPRLVAKNHDRPLDELREFLNQHGMMLAEAKAIGNEFHCFCVRKEEPKP